MDKMICDFCGVENSTENPVISGDKATICKACAKSAYEIINNHQSQSDNTEDNDNITPKRDINS